MQLEKAIANSVVQGLLEPVSTEKLDKQVNRAYPSGKWDEYRAALKLNNNAPDQIARFEKAGVILQPKQLEFAAWARLLDDAPHIEGEEGVPELGIGGARGGGKSMVIFAQMALDDCQRMPGLKCLYLRKVGKQATEQMEDLVKAVLGNVKYTYTHGRVGFPNGSSIRIGHFNYAKDVFNYLGLEYDVIAIEEATTLPEAAHSAMRMACRSNKEGWRPRIYNSTNPLGVGHAQYKKRFVDHERKYGNITHRTRKFIPATVDDNKFLNEDYVGTLNSLRGVELRAYRFGDWDISAGAYFDDWRYDRHVIGPLLDIPNDWRVWASMDYGYNHWNMIYLHTQDNDGVKYTFMEFAHRKHHPDEIGPDLLKYLEGRGWKPDRLHKFLAGSDVFNKTGASRKTVAEKWRDLGFRLTQADTSPGSRVAGAHYMAKLLGNSDRVIAPTWFITANCVRLIECLPMLERDTHNAEDVLKVDANDFGEGGDDPYDAVRYGLFYAPYVKGQRVSFSGENPIYN